MQKQTSKHNSMFHPKSHRSTSLKSSNPQKKVFDLKVVHHSSNKKKKNTKNYLKPTPKGEPIKPVTFCESNCS
ncbi:hypothetical protein Hanom_Chr17g01554131 [Helianthus anomalus]